MEKRVGLRVKHFRFENEKITPWVNQSKGNVEYSHYLETPGITPNNKLEGLLSFNFRLEILPDIGEISFSGDCILESSNLKTIIMVLKSPENSKLKIKNRPILEVINKLLLRRLLDHSKEIGEKEGIRFHSYELVLKNLGLEHISFKKDREPQILTLQENKLIPKQNRHQIKNFAGFKDFIFTNKKIIPGENMGKMMDNAIFEVNSKLYKPRLLSKMSLLIKYHYTMKISPDIGTIEFDGQFKMDSFKNEIKHLLKHENKDLVEALQNVIAKAGTIHAEKIGKEYRIYFSAQTVLRNLGYI